MMHDRGITMEIDRSLLSQAQLKDLDQWTELFHGPHWVKLCERYNDRIASLQNAYQNVTDVNSLGRIQGALLAYRDLFVVLPDVINYEFLIATGQIGNEQEGHEDEDDPTTPPLWDQ
jgi:hypothetical protein